MNLINDPWLPVIRNDDSRDIISPKEISDPSIINIASPRADFNGALHQFLVGLLQTACMPKDMADWYDKWNHPPEKTFLQSRFEKVADFFNLDADGPSFMQDYNLSGGKKSSVSQSIANLLIEAPGGKTLDDNLDHFIKGDQVNVICRSCGASALFNLQISAPAGGKGHRTGIRGGGPLTTLIMPIEDKAPASLWKRLWLNIFPLDEVKSFTGEIKHSKAENIFPWLAETRTSEKNGVDTFSENVHPLQMYWAMPRRIRLEFSDGVDGPCDLCGRRDDIYVTGFNTKNYGVNYSGVWQHPLSPYNHDLKDEKPPLPLHAQKGGVSYRHWLGLVAEHNKKSARPAKIVNHYLEKKLDRLNGIQAARIWAFGYDMDKMKARCWYESVMPIYPIPQPKQALVIYHIHELIGVAEKAANDTRSAVKKAWFRRPKDKKGDWSFVDQSFWQNTEIMFYDCLQSLINAEDVDEKASDVREKWGKTVVAQGFHLFDQYTLSALVEDSDVKRVVTARNELAKWLGASKNKLTGKTKGK